MTAKGMATTCIGEPANQQLEALRRSFDDDIHNAPPEDAKNTEEFVLLTLSGEAYGLPVRHALEILPLPTIVPVPGLPPAVLGIINFRGQILSVTRVHGVLGIAVGESGPSTRIVVTKGLPLVTGILADSVEGIAEVSADDICSLPATVGDGKAQLLSGQICVDDRVVFLLDMERLSRLPALYVTQD